jgi:hypothetical protein
MKNALLYIFILNLISCNSLQDKYNDRFNGEWQITKFQYKELNIIQSENYVLLGFEKHHHFWITKLDNTNDFTSADYRIFNKLDTLRIDIKNCEDRRFEGNYNLYVDTIKNTKEEYIIQITLDSENNLIQAIKPKLKHLFAPEN